MSWTRRDFVHGVSAAGAAGLLSPWSVPATAEGPLETTTLRLVYDPDAFYICFGAQYVAEEMLRVEGFTEVSYVARKTAPEPLALGDVDINVAYVPQVLHFADRGYPLVMLSGMHIGSFTDSG